ncbi:MAG: UDP-3-O-(3-hydroxymyristoyl)glucosamine N-acyltransferase, partial [Candidatus Omnitrophica bacterium]|nr:UDP-3-O-(3-hydroxymyristoyl)glucosamine N-acyltransferase [Candidatus Omnitrophota bacterium]
ALEFAIEGELSFAENPKYVPLAQQSQACAIIVSMDFPVLEKKALLRVENPRLAFFRTMHLLAPQRKTSSGVHREAIVAPDAHIGEGVSIKELAVIRSKAHIGSGTIVESGAHIGERVVIGKDCFIGPNAVVLYDCHIGDRVILHAGVVVGADGFGYIWSDGRHLKIPQLGNVLIEDDVELGANVCVDRATFGSTLIKRGTKVDNLVQIAHNDVVGEHVIMSGQVGLAGSVHIGSRVMFGGQSGVADHVTIGDDVRVGAKSAVIKNVPSGQTVWGSPARPIAQVKREMAALSFLPELLREIRNKRKTSRKPKHKSQNRAHSVR